MDSLELTTFKNIFNRLSVETQESFIKEIKYGIYYDMVDEMGKHEFLSTLDAETKDFILTMTKKSNEIITVVAQEAILKLQKYALVFKITNEVILLKDSKVRLFNLSNDNEIYMCISPSNLINSIDEDGIKWLNEWESYSLVLMKTLNIPTSRWKFISTNGKIKSIREEFVSLRIFDNMQF